MMDNKKKMLIVLVIVLSIIVVGLGSFIVCDKFIKNDELKEETNNNGNNDQLTDEDNNLDNDNNDQLIGDGVENNDSTVDASCANYTNGTVKDMCNTCLELTNTEWDLFTRTCKCDDGYHLSSSECVEDSDLDILGKELYARISIYDELYKTFFFKKNYEDHSTFNNEEKLLFAYQIMSKGESCISYLFDNWCEKRQFKKNFLESAVIKLWGSNNNVKYTSFESGKNITWDCELNDNNYICIAPEGMGGDCLDRVIINYNGTRYDGDDIIVEVKYLLISCYDSLLYDYSIYADPEKTILLGEGNDDDELYNEYNDSAGIFEVTFKKDTKTNDYYFYKSELKK